MNIEWNVIDDEWYVMNIEWHGYVYVPEPSQPPKIVCLIFGGKLRPPKIVT